MMSSLRRSKASASAPPITPKTLFKLLEALDDNDDVQRVATNFEVADEILERLSA